MCVSVDVCLCAHLRVSVSVYVSVRLCVCMCVCMCVSMSLHVLVPQRLCGDRRTTCQRCWFFSSITWVLGINYRLQAWCKCLYSLRHLVSTIFSLKIILLFNSIYMCTFVG